MRDIGAAMRKKHQLATVLYAAKHNTFPRHPCYHGMKVRRLADFLASNLLRWFVSRFRPFAGCEPWKRFPGRVNAPHEAPLCWVAWIRGCTVSLRPVSSPPVSLF